MDDRFRRRTAHNPEVVCRKHLLLACTIAHASAFGSWGWVSFANALSRTTEDANASADKR
jgi:hypothetical protein